MKDYRLTNEETSMLCASLAHLVGAGISTGDALTILKNDETNPELQKILESMAAGADRGDTLFSLFKDAGCFPSYVCVLMEVGERVGQSEKVLKALADYYDTQAHMQKRLSAALLYPCILLAVVLLVLIIMLVWILPIFDDVYARLGSGLTGIAGGLLSVGNVLRGCLPFICAILIILFVASLIPPVRRWVVSIVTKCFGDRGPWAAVNSAKFIQALELALESGMTDQSAVHLACGLSTDSSSFSDRCNRCLALVDEGKPLSQALLETGMLDNRNCRLFEVGMRSGHGQQVLQTIARELSESSQEAVENKLSKIEPAIVITACVLIGLVLLSVMLPLMDIMNAIG